MTMEIIRIYTGVEEKMGTSDRLRKVGLLRVAHAEKRWDAFQSCIPITKAAGVPDFRAVETQWERAINRKIWSRMRPIWTGSST